MGNQASCTPHAISSTGAVKVISNDGRVEEYRRLVKAGELMLENPRQFVCDSGHLQVGQRIPGLAADEELERHRQYFLLPMDMLYSVLTEEEMDVLSCRASSAMKCGVSKNVGRIFPSEGSRPPPPPPIPEPVKTVSRQRSWTPALDTIEEAP